MQRSGIDTIKYYTFSKILSGNTIRVPNSLDQDLSELSWVLTGCKGNQQSTLENELTSVLSEVQELQIDKKLLMNLISSASPYFTSNLIS